MLENLSVGAKIVIVVMLAVVIIVAIVLGFLYFRQKPAEAPALPVVNETESPPRTPIATTPQQPALNLPEMTEDEKSEEQLQNLARIFAERFGSFSNQGTFQNLIDIESLVNDQMKQQLENQRQELIQKYSANGDYYGVTTMAPIVKTESFGEDKAVMVVTTQRKETQDGDTKNYKQDIKVEFTKQDGQWLISGAYWQ